MLGNANGINLNNDSLRKISKIGGLGVVLATQIVRHRPIRRWSDLAKVQGFDRELVNDLRGSGAVLGRPQMAKPSAPPRRTARQPTTQDKRAQVGRRRKPIKRPARRRATNIFSGEGYTLE